MSEVGVKKEEEEVKEEELASDSAVLLRLKEILKTVDLDVTTEKMLRSTLEVESGRSLVHLKAEIRKEIETYLDSQAAVEEAEDEPVEKKKRKAGGFSSKLSRLSPALATFLGVDQESRPQVVKKLWEYIKANNLQNPKDKRVLILDDKLKTIFSGKTTVFSMNTQLSKHIFRDDEWAGGGPSKKAKSGKRESDDDDDDNDEDDGDDDAVKRKRDKPSKKSGGSSGNPFTRPYKLSQQLADLVGSSEMSRPALTSWFSKYSKEHDLINPSNKKEVICNDALKSLFKVESYMAFGGIQKLISPHLS